MARGAVAKNSRRNSGFVAYSAPCPFIRAKFDRYSREKKLFIVEALGVVSCRWCKEIHTLEEFISG